MFKDGQVVIGLKIYENEATQNKHVKEKKNKQKLGFLDNGIMHTRTGLCTHEFSLHA